MSEDAKRVAFISPVVKIAGLELRPFSITSYELLIATCNKTYLGEKVTHAQKRKDTLAFIFMHSADPDEVLQLAAYKDDWDKACQRFGMGLTIGRYAEAAANIKDVVDAALAAQDFTVDDSDSRADPN